MKARILWQYERKWKEAEEEYTKAFELDPNLIKDIGFFNWMGRRQEAFDEIEKGVEQSDPLNMLHQLLLGWQFLFLREFDRAIKQATKAMALDPEHRSPSPYQILEASYEQKGMEEKAFETRLQWLQLRNTSEERIAALREAFDDGGLEGVRRLQPDPEPPEGARPDLPAAHFARLGDKDKAFEWLEKAWCSELPLWGFEKAPSCWRWDSLRSDPRFEELLRGVNLPEEPIQKHLAPR
jgi:tetratricopeptide (TPR) repeat protein